MTTAPYTKALAWITAALILMATVGHAPETAQAAAAMGVSASATVTEGQEIIVTVTINTGGQSANAFDATFTYPTSLFEGVRGSYSGSVCTLPITQPDPSGGSAPISCGRPSGYTGSGTLATIVLRATGAGSGSFGLSSCQVLANDGLGTDITGGCSGKSVTVTAAAATPAPTASASAGATPAPTRTPKPSSSATPKPSSTPTPGGTAKPVESAQTPAPTPTPEGPAVVTLPDESPTPTPQAGSAPQTERRTIGQAVTDVFGSLREFGQLKGNINGLAALLLTLIPFLILAFGTVFLVYRLYILERRRRRTLDRLFELELAELAGLEGKMDLLAEKGAKGREQFRAEFETAKANILRQLKPDFGKPVDGKAAPPPAEPPKA